MRRFAPLAAVLCCFAAPALADTTAEALRAEVEFFLDGNATLFGQQTLLHGPVSVEEEGGALRVTVSDLAVADGREHAPLPIGAVSFLVRPREDGRYAFSEVVVPERIVSLDAEGAELGSLVFDLVTLSGIWSPELQSWTDLDLLLRGLEFRSSRSGLLVGLGLAALQVVTQENAAGGLWDQVHDYRLERLIVADQEMMIELRDAVLKASLEGLDVRVFSTLGALLQDLQTAAAAGDETRLEALRKSLAATGSGFERAQYRLEASGIVGSDETGREVVRLARAGATLASDPSGDASGGRMEIALDGEGLALDLSPKFQPYADLIPQRWNLPLTYDRLPEFPLWQYYADFVIAGLRDDPATVEASAMAFMQSLIEGMGSAGSRLLVRGLFVESPLWRLDGKAAFIYDLVGGIGSADLVLTGVDHILALAEGLQDPDAKQALSTVALGLMGVGQVAALPDGQVGYRYSFLFTPDGKVSMNGFAFGDLLNKAIPQ